MRIKKYMVNSLQEGKSVIIKDLGEDAIILSTRVVKKAGTDSKEIIEMVAALDDNPVPNIAARQIQANKSMKDGNVEYEQALETRQTELLMSTRNIYDELSNVKTIISGIADSVKYRYAGSLGDINGKIYKMLREAEFSDEFSLSIVGKIIERGANLSLSGAFQAARQSLTERLSFHQPFKKDAPVEISTFIGPTGCGKTCTLVKLALVCKLLLQSEVMVISTDTGKVGGAEQLQTYCSIAAIPFRSVYNPNDLQKIVNEEMGRSHIFIDTSGAGYYKREMHEIVRFIGSIAVNNIFLVLSMTSSTSSIKKAIEEFSVLKPNGLILTKLDEAARIGNIIEALQDTDLFISYITNGIKIPDDIEPATQEKLWDILIPKPGTEGMSRDNGVQFAEEFIVK
jgi:flagellar biosynthesis protein FlhF